MKTLVISDVHSGHATSRDKELLDMLKKEQWDQLVINGDLVDSPLVSSVSLLQLLDYLSDKTLSMIGEVNIGIGNHDQDIYELIARGREFIPFGNEGLTIEDSGKKFHIRHGHVGLNGKPWDKYLMGYKAPTALGNWLEQTLCLFGGRLGRKVSLWGHHLRKHLFNVKKQVREEALALAIRERWDYIICGHTHFPEVVIRGDITYINQGSWAEEIDCSFVVIENGKAELKFWKDQKRK